MFFETWLIKKRRKQEKIKDWTSSDQWISFYKTLESSKEKVLKEQQALKDIIPF